MAKKWNPSENQISAYEQILKRYNKIRKQIISAHHNLEQIVPSGRMPSLVVPERHRKMTLRQMRLTGRRVFLLKLRQLKKVVHGGLQAFYSDYKKSYLQLYRDYIIQDMPEGYQNRFYSDLQIKEADSPEMAQFMHDYNSLVNMNGTVFTLLLKMGKIPQFKYLYAQFVQDLDTYDNFAKLFHKAIRTARYIRIKDANDILSNSNWSKKSVFAQKLYKKMFDQEQLMKEDEE